MHHHPSLLQHPTAMYMYLSLLLLVVVLQTVRTSALPPLNIPTTFNCNSCGASPFFCKMSYYCSSCTADLFNRQCLAAKHFQPGMCYFHSLLLLTGFFSRLEAIQKSNCKLCSQPSGTVQFEHPVARSSFVLLQNPNFFSPSDH